MTLAHGEHGLECMQSQLQRALEMEEQVRLAYLYGSALLGDDFRDVDVAVWAPETDRMPASLREAWLGGLGLLLERSLTPRCPLDLSVGLREYDRTMLAGIREWSTANGPSPT